MTRIIFGGMSKREIVGVFPKESRRNFPNVKIQIIASLDELMGVINAHDSNFVVHRFPSDDVITKLGTWTGVVSHKINSELRYNPLSEKDYTKLINSNLAYLERN